MNDSENEKNATNKHKYRVNLYLGKELYNSLSVLADGLHLPLSTTTRIILETGVNFANKVDLNQK